VTTLSIALKQIGDQNSPPPQRQIRIELKLAANTHPELFGELEHYPPRERAERMRALAMVGLLVPKAPQAESSISDNKRQSEHRVHAKTLNAPAICDSMSNLESIDDADKLFS
jgi:hypothetical protein